MLGVVTIELVLAPASILMLGAPNALFPIVTVAESLLYSYEVNRPNIGAATTAVAAPIPAEAANYT